MVQLCQDGMNPTVKRGTYLASTALSTKAAYDDCKPIVTLVLNMKWTITLHKP